MTDSIARQFARRGFINTLERAMKHDTQYIADAVEVDGLEYSVLDGIDPSSIKDDELRGLWVIASATLREIQKRLRVEV